MHRPSSMTAWRYGRLRALESLIGDEMGFLENSARSLAVMRGA